jgi:hypothetical protein
MSVSDLKLKHIALDMDGSVLVFRLNRPPANAHDLAMIRDPLRHEREGGGDGERQPEVLLGGGGYLGDSDEIR